MEKFAKCQILAIFVIAEIHKIALDALFFQNFENPHSKNSDLWVKIQFVQKIFPRA